MPPEPTLKGKTDPVKRRRRAPGPEEEMGSVCRVPARAKFARTWGAVIAALAEIYRNDLETY